MCGKNFMNKKIEDPFRLLMNKQIYAILDGDTKFESYKFSDDGTTIQIAMPYMRGSDLQELCVFFEVKLGEWYGCCSRWLYLEYLFEDCIETDRCSELLAHLFAKQQFSKMLYGHGVNAIEDAHKVIVDTVIEKINGILYFSNSELIRIGNQFIVIEKGNKVEMQAPKIKNVDREYIKNTASLATEAINRGDFDSAVSKSRTLLEEVFCYVIELKNEKPSESGDIKKLYMRVKDLYRMHGDEKTDKRINELLSGLEKIVSSVSEMRNKYSDAHGIGKNRIRIEEHHACLLVNTAVTMADFILSVAIKQTQHIQ